MAKTFYFISGLPRSGSTLLAAILKQNPRFHAGMSSAVGALCRSVLNQLSAGSEFGPLVDRQQRKNILRGLLESYYQHLPEPVIFDTNRMWCANLPLLRDLFPDTKVICSVRNMSWIMDSMERKYRENPYELTRLFANDAQRSTVYSRMETLAGRENMVGYAWTALKGAYYSDLADMLLLVDYEMLARSPQKVLPLIYDFIGEEHFAHDFDNVVYDADDFDANLGVAGLHTVDKKVQFKPRQTVLPPDLFEKYAQMSFWLDPRQSKANVIKPKKGDGGNIS